jgi:hypothetical protein
LTTKSDLAFNFVAVTRREEMWAHEQEDDVCPLNSFVDAVPPLVTARDHSIVPFNDLTNALSHHKLKPDGFHEGLIFVRV